MPSCSRLIFPINQNMHLVRCDFSSVPQHLEVYISQPLEARVGMPSLAANSDVHHNLFASKILTQHTSILRIENY
jgi:hypothetical protein